MANNVNVDLGPSDNTGVNTSNPQSGGQDSSIAGKPQTLQTANSTSSINNQSSGVAIKLQPTSGLRTSAITTSAPKSNHKISTGGAIIVGVLVVVAVALSLYIYLSDKRAVKNT